MAGLRGEVRYVNNHNPDIRTYKRGTQQTFSVGLRLLSYPSAKPRSHLLLVGPEAHLFIFETSP